MDGEKFIEQILIALKHNAANYEVSKDAENKSCKKINILNNACISDTHYH